ncbi:hypothetical protein ACTHSJ_25800 [Paenibacillus cellulositrophicus]|uniref:hypothetical protein n=1 Tax=Paenibacillus cellulositrophicus TaxID=562959 RepID=UPI003F7E3620
MEKAVNIVILCVLAVFVVDRMYSIYTNVRVNQSLDRSDKVIAEQERRIAEDEWLYKPVERNGETQDGTEEVLP